MNSNPYLFLREDFSASSPPDSNFIPIWLKKLIHKLTIQNIEDFVVEMNKLLLEVDVTIDNVHYLGTQITPLCTRIEFDSNGVGRIERLCQTAHKNVFLFNYNLTDRMTSAEPGKIKPMTNAEASTWLKSRPMGRSLFHGKFRSSSDLI